MIFFLEEHEFIVIHKLSESLIGAENWEAKETVLKNC